MCRPRFGMGLLLGLGLLVLSGCRSDPNARQAVSGTVTFQGQLLDQGAIQFTPTEKGPSEGGEGIANGSYRIPRDRGLVPGKYKVAIFSYDEKGKKVAASENVMPGDAVATQFKERIPAKYNVKTTLSAEVSSGGSNTFDFKLD